MGSSYGDNDYTTEDLDNNEPAIGGWHRHRGDRGAQAPDERSASYAILRGDPTGGLEKC